MPHHSREPHTPRVTIHKATGQAFVRHDGRDPLPRPVRHPEARAANDELVARWLANGRRPSGPRI